MMSKQSKLTKFFRRIILDIWKFIRKHWREYQWNKKQKEAERRRLRGLRREAYYKELGRQKAIRDDKWDAQIQENRRRAMEQWTQEYEQDPLGRKRIEKVYGLKKRKRSR